jgi:hypothetical protein
MAKPELRDEEKQQIQQPSLWGRVQLYYEQHTRAVTTAVIAVLIGGTTLGIVSYRETARHTRSMQEAYGAASIAELEALQTKYPDSEAAPIILFRLAQMYQNEGKLEDLKKALKLYGDFGNQYPKHELSIPAGEAMMTLMKDIQFLGESHEEFELSHLLFTHPELTSIRAKDEKDLDEEERMGPRWQADPLVMIFSGEVHLTLRVFCEEAPIVWQGFLNDVRNHAFEGTPLLPAADDPRRFVLISGLERPATFDAVRNDRPLIAGSLAMALGADGKPILGRYYIFDDTTAALAAAKDRYLVFGHLSSAPMELRMLSTESKVTKTAIENDR